LSEYPDDFFKGKTSITLHLAHMKFPEATYRYSSEYDRSAHLEEIDPRYLSGPLIAAMPMYGHTKRETMALLKDFKEVYYHRMVNYPPTGVRGEVDARFTEKKLLATSKGKASVWGGHGTCLHTAFYMAVLLGAKAINLIGAGHGLYKPGMEHFAEVEESHHAMRPGYRPFSDPIEHVPLLEQTLALGRAAEKLGIRFNWYRTWTPSMDDRILVDADWLANQKRQAKRIFSPLRRMYWSLHKRPVNRIVSRF
jgi:hypothetical protein